MIGLIVGCLFLASSCRMSEAAAIRKLGRIERQWPGLFSDSLAVVSVDSVGSDTVIVRVPVPGRSAELELVLELSSLNDSIEVLEGKIRLLAKVSPLPGGAVGSRVVYVRAECLPDTVSVGVPVRVRTVVYRPVPCTVSGGSAGMPWWWLVMTAVVSGALTYFLGVKSEK